MSQIKERFIARLVRGFNAEFCGSKGASAEEITVKGNGISMGGGAGLAITIGDKRVEFNEYGEVSKSGPAERSATPSISVDPAVGAVAKCQRCGKHFADTSKVGKQCLTADRNGDRCIGEVETYKQQEAAQPIAAGMPVKQRPDGKWEPAIEEEATAHVASDFQPVKVKRHLRRHEGKLQHSDNQRDWSDLVVH